MLDKEFGEINISYRANMRRITARWKNNRLHINTPLFATERIIAQFIENNREQLRTLFQRSQATQNTIVYHLGQRIPCFRNEILITSLNFRANTTAYKRDAKGNLFIYISAKDDITSNTKQNAISSALKALMKSTAPHVLVPFAWEVARELNLSPADIVIGRGSRKLGHCTTKGVIQLSFMLMFMPETLVRYIICHELAHLTEMNHSPRFHALCNHYCNGKEKALEKQLKGFKYPLK